MMSELSIREVAALARIALMPEEEQRFAAELADILRFARELQKADTADVPPTGHVLDLENVLREDCPGEPLSQQAVLQTAPDTEGSFFSVPRAFE